VDRADGDADLHAIFVLPELWKQGIGRVLLDEAAEIARARGANAMRVVANPNALVFYKSCGYKIMGETQTQFGSGITMEKLLR
jgi:GNAT superfamily N-acetyltransferase